MRRGTVLGAVLVAAVVLASCSSSSSSSTTSSAPNNTTASTSGGGGSAGTITIGAISSLTGPISADFDAFVPGVQAYLNTLNANGGAEGHKIVLSYNLDDGGSPSTFTQLAHTLVQQDNVFAVFASTFFFNPNLFIQTNTPTFGYNVSGNWAPQPNLFAAGGSTQDYNYGAPAPAYLIKQLKAKSVAIVSYGPAISSSYDACNTDAQKLSAGGINVSYTDLDAQLGGDFSAAVQKMQQANVDFVMTCMQGSDNITLARSLQQYGVDAHQLWFDGYDNSLLQQYHNLMQGVYLNVNGNVPFQVTNAYPGVYPGMKAYETAMAKYAPKFTYSDVALQGWQSGALLAAGIENTVKAGLPLTQANVISQINQISSFTAQGVTNVVNWTTAHDLTQQTFPVCSAFVKVSGSQFVPAVAAPPQTFLCFEKVVNLKDPMLATPQPGTPGT